MEHGWSSNSFCSAPLPTLLRCHREKKEKRVKRTVSKGENKLLAHSSDRPRHNFIKSHVPKRRGGEEKGRSELRIQKKRGVRKSPPSPFATPSPSTTIACAPEGW